MSAARDAAEQYDRAGAEVVAVNPGSLASHQKWAEQNGFGFPICVDTDKKVAAAYGALKPEGGIQRSVFVVNRKGTVVWAQEGAPATEEILAAVGRG